jgi:hypothetical protein
MGHVILCANSTKNTWSGQLGLAVRNSITVRIWEEIETGLNYGATGPEVFLTVMRRIQHASASTIYTLLQKLNKDPGMNVDTFTTKVPEMVHRIEGNATKSIPSDLSTVVATYSPAIDVDEFKLTTITIFNIVDLDPTAMIWRDIVSDMKTKYHSLEGISHWPHKIRRSTSDELPDLQGSLNTLSQKLDGLQKGAGSNQGQKDLSEIQCFRCRKKGHYSRNCPDEEKGGNNGNSRGGGKSQGESWTRQKSAAEDPHTKTVDSIEYIWCNHCGR